MISFEELLVSFILRQLSHRSFIITILTRNFPRKGKPFAFKSATNTRLGTNWLKNSLSSIHKTPPIRQGAKDFHDPSIWKQDPLTLKTEAEMNFAGDQIGTEIMTKKGIFRILP